MTASSTASSLASTSTSNSPSELGGHHPQHLAAVFLQLGRADSADALKVAERLRRQCRRRRRRRRQRRIMGNDTGREVMGTRHFGAPRFQGREPRFGRSLQSRCDRRGTRTCELAWDRLGQRDFGLGRNRRTRAKPRRSTLSCSAHRCRVRARVHLAGQRQCGIEPQTI